MLRAAQLRPYFAIGLAAVLAATLPPGTRAQLSAQDRPSGPGNVPAKTRELLKWAAETGDARVKQNIAQAERVFTALRQKDWELLAEVMPEDHIQHAPGIPTGRSGLVNFFSRLPISPNVYLDMAHVVAEGDFVVVHRKVARRGGMMAIDILRFDQDGQYVEHWDLFQPIPEMTASGRTMWDDAEQFQRPIRVSAAEVKKNKQLVLGFLDLTFTQDKVEDAVAKYVGDVYFQHNPDVEDGPAALTQLLRQPDAPRFEYHPQIVVGQNDLVSVFSRVNLRIGDSDPVEHAVVDLLRVRDGKIVEHWDVVQRVPNDFAHGNGFFPARTWLD